MTQENNRTNKNRLGQATMNGYNINILNKLFSLQGFYGEVHNRVGKESFRTKKGVNKMKKLIGVYNNKNPL